MGAIDFDQICELEKVLFATGQYCQQPPLFLDAEELEQRLIASKAEIDSALGMIASAQKRVVA